MTIIAEKDRETIREVLETELADRVELLLVTRPRSPIYVPGREECQTCDETRELLEELVGLSDKLSLETHDLSARPDAATTFNVSEVPAVLIRRRADALENGDRPGVEEAPAVPPPNVRFLGLPAGYEFSTLLADIVDVSKGRTDLSEETRAAVRAIDRPVHIRVFVTPT
jgi:alkyl hydroperoxide reductase subunit AhpF